MLLPLVVDELLVVAVLLVPVPFAAADVVGEAVALVIPDDKGAAPYSNTTIPSSDWTDEVQFVLLVVVT